MGAKARCSERSGIERLGTDPHDEVAPGHNVGPLSARPPMTGSGASEMLNGYRGS